MNLAQLEQINLQVLSKEELIHLKTRVSQVKSALLTPSAEFTAFRGKTNSRLGAKELFPRYQKLESNGRIECGCIHCISTYEVYSADEWLKRLFKSKLDSQSKRYIVQMEKEVVKSFEDQRNKFIDSVMEQYKQTGRIDFQMLNKQMTEHLNTVSDKANDPVMFYHKYISDAASESALKRIGNRREDIRKIKKSAQYDPKQTRLNDLIDRSMSKVKSVPDDVVSDMKSKWVEKGTSTDLLSDLLHSEEREIKENPPSDREVRDALGDLWNKKRHVYQRVIRTESVNLYAKVQLQEWFDQGVTEVERVSINDTPTCLLCRELSSPGRNVYLIEELLKQDYPVSFMSHPLCFIDHQIPIFTSKGWKHIGKIKVGDLVLTHQGKFQKVKKLLEPISYKGEVISIETSEVMSYTSYGRVSVTLEHPFYIVGKGWIKASDLVVGDKMKMLAGRCLCCEKLIPFYKKYCSNHCQSSGVVNKQWRNRREDPIEIVAFGSTVSKAMKKANVEDPDLRFRCTKHISKMLKGWVEMGVHPFQDPENQKKGMKALAEKHGGQSFLEMKMKWLLEQKKLNFIQQYPIEKFEKDKLGKKRNWFVDFVLKDYKIAVECDGERWHGKNALWFDELEDSLRTQDIEKQGFTILRFTESQIMKNLKNCSDEIDRVLMNHNEKYEFLEVEIKRLNRWNLKFPRRLYNLSVDEDESFIASGLISHNCRCGYIPRINFSIFDELEQDLMATNPPTTFDKAEDMQLGEVLVKDVPLEFEELIRKMIGEAPPNSVVSFVPDVTTHLLWQKDMMEDLIMKHGKNATTALQSLIKDMRGKIISYVTKDHENVLISGFAADAIPITSPVARLTAEQAFDDLTDSQGKFVDEKFQKAKQIVSSEMNDGIQYQVKGLFVSPLASRDVRSYFVESYVAYFVEPIKLFYFDGQLYEWFKNQFFSKEYIDSPLR